MSPAFAGRLAPIVKTQRAYNEELCRRVQDLRIARGLTQERMAELLGIPKHRYKKYEERSPMPLFLIERFSIIVGRDVDYIVTGAVRRRQGTPRLAKRADS
jgi:transcriptional regulator with XRE-family HTH domain